MHRNNSAQLYIFRHRFCCIRVTKLLLQDKHRQFRESPTLPNRVITQQIFPCTSSNRQKVKLPILTDIFKKEKQIVKKNVESKDTPKTAKGKETNYYTTWLLRRDCGTNGRNKFGKWLKNRGAQ